MDNQNYPNNQQGGYYPNMQPPKQTSGLAIASMVLGIVALLTSCFGMVGVICGVLAVIFGGIAIFSHKAGKGMAIAGLVCGIVALIPAIYFVSAATTLMSMF